MKSYRRSILISSKIISIIQLRKANNKRVYNPKITKPTPHTSEMRCVCYHQILKTMFRDSRPAMREECALDSTFSR